MGLLSRTDDNSTEPSFQADSSEIVIKRVNSLP